MKIERFLFTCCILLKLEGVFGLIPAQFRRKDTKIVICQCLFDNSLELASEGSVFPEQASFVNTLFYAQQHGYDYKLINVNSTYFRDVLGLHESWSKLFAIYSLLSERETEEGNVGIHGNNSFKYDYVVYLDGSQYFISNPSISLFDQMKTWNRFADIYMISDDVVAEELKTEKLSEIIVLPSFQIWKRSETTLKLLERWIHSPKIDSHDSYWNGNAPYELGSFHDYLLPKIDLYDIILHKCIIPSFSSTTGFLSSITGHWNNLVEEFPSISLFQQNHFFQSFSVIYSLFLLQSNHQNHKHSFYIISQNIYNFYLQKPSFWLDSTATMINEKNETVSTTVYISAFQKDFLNLDNICKEYKINSHSSCAVYKQYIEESQRKREEEILQYDSMKAIQKYQILKEFCHFYPLNILDIGAHVGLWSESMRKEVFPNSSYFLIEGNSKHEDILKVRSFLNYEITLIGNFTGNISFYRSFNNNFSTGNTIYRENTPYFFGEVITMNITTIDELIARKRKERKDRQESEESGSEEKNHPFSFQMMKLDIQGGEYDALLGGMKTLQENGIELIQTECPLMNYNEGSSLFLELHLLMEKLGFSIFQIVDLLVLDRPGFFVQFDIFWVRKSSRLWNKECTKHFRSPSTLTDFPSSLPVSQRSKLDDLLNTYVDRYQDVGE
jgi:hypothetical protein